jgi:general secretion pathway protein E/type IV pilus assembly protein PilB
VISPADDFVLRLAHDHGQLTTDQLADARAPNSPEINRITNSARVLELLAAKFDLPLVDLSTARISDGAKALVPAEFARREKLIPLALEGDVLRVAVRDPFAIDALDRLAIITGLVVQPALAAADAIEAAIERIYGRADDEKPALDFDLETPISALNETPAATTAPATDPDESSDAPIIQLVYRIIQDAVRQRASDIHLEPLEKRFRVRYRIDGVLSEAENPPKRLQSAVISRIKIMANISIAEKRVPQDGRMQVRIDDRPLDLRVSTLPTTHGESIVMRILDQSGLRLGLAELGFFDDDQATFQRLIGSADGIILVTGPTGSGKTTTLYSCLHHINQPNRKIITVEDPIEYQLAGINQVPVRQEIGMTFASALRAMLRQSPNTIMVGEIRDRETAEIAINASLTGHLVFSTLHTNDAPGAITRLMDMGAKPFMISGALRLVVAQRLVRKICENCSRPHSPSAVDLIRLGLPASAAASANFRQGAGCPLCGNSGFRGRIGIFELLVVSEDVQRLIHENVPASQLRAVARSAGMRTMREDGIRKVTAGLTTIDEVVSITVDDSD